MIINWDQGVLNPNQQGLYANRVNGLDFLSLNFPSGILKVSTVALASIGKIAGVAIASISKVAGIVNA